MATKKKTKKKQQDPVVDDSIQDPDDSNTPSDDSNAPPEGDKKSEEVDKNARRNFAGEVLKCRCRECKHYIMQLAKPVTNLVEDYREATSNWRKDFCGTQPVRTRGELKGKPINNMINCQGKTFEPVES